MGATNTFAGESLDRAASLRRDDQWVRERLESPESRAVVVAAEGPYLDCSAEPWRPLLVATRELPSPKGPVLLGIDERGEALFAIDADRPDGLESLTAGTRATGLRAAAAHLRQEDAGLLAYATSILSWHRTHPFCARCGAPTREREAGHVRACERCGALHYPRTDPVVIVLVEDAERVLLGRQPAWPAGRYSALAGFVEPGESLEDAAVREVHEEARVEIDELRYRSSQPWPFPGSLMVAYRARYRSGEARTGDGELEDVRWFDRDELREADGERSALRLPPRTAIARRLIDEWLS